MEKVVSAKVDYNDYLKKKIDARMEVIQSSGHKAGGVKEKEKSVLNKSIDTVAGILKISKWWT